MSLEWVLLGFRILAAVILYTFLGIAFYIIWRDLSGAARGPGSRANITHHLRVVDPAGDDTLAKGQTLGLQPVSPVGRNPENVIVLTDASVSARHARLRLDNGVWWLEDLNSRNGTTLNELALTRPAPLTNGDVIGFGRVRLRLETLTEL